MRQKKLRTLRTALEVDDSGTSRALSALAFTLAVTAFLRGFEADPVFAAIMAVALGLYARLVGAVVVHEYAEGGSTTTGSGPPA